MSVSIRSAALLLAGLTLAAPAFAKEPKAKKGKPTTTETSTDAAPVDAGTPAEATPTDGKATEDESESKLTEIKDCGVSSMDGVFKEARDVQGKLETSRVSLKTARQNVKSALGVAMNKPMSVAFEELKKTAGDKIEVAMEGTMPKLKAKDAVPENVQQAIDAVNGLMTEAKNTGETVVSLKSNITSLADKAKGFPTQIVAEVKGNPLGAAKASSTVTANLKAISEMGTQADKLANISTKMVTDFTSVFGSGAK